MQSLLYELKFWAKDKMVPEQENLIYTRRGMKLRWERATRVQELMEQPENKAIFPLCFQSQGS